MCITSLKVNMLGGLSIRSGDVEINDGDNRSRKVWLLLAYMMPSLRTMFTTGSAVALALFTAIAAVLSVVAGLRSKSFTLGCLSFAGCCVALTALFLLKSSWLTEAFSAVLSALCLFTPFEEFVNSSFSIPTLVHRPKSSFCACKAKDTRQNKPAKKSFLFISTWYFG